MKVKVIIWQEDDVWCGSVPALPGCHTWGETYDHLIEMLKEAIEAWLDVANEKANLDKESKLAKEVEISV